MIDSICPHCGSSDVHRVEERQRYGQTDQWITLHCMNRHCRRTSGNLVPDMAAEVRAGPAIGTVYDPVMCAMRYVPQVVADAIGSLGRLRERSLHAPTSKQWVLTDPGGKGRPWCSELQDVPPSKPVHAEVDGTRYGYDDSGRKVWRQRPGQALEVRDEADAGWVEPRSSQGYKFSPGENAYRYGGQLLYGGTGNASHSEWPVAETIPPGSLVCLNDAGELVPWRERKQDPCNTMPRGRFTCPICGGHGWRSDVDRGGSDWRYCTGTLGGKHCTYGWRKSWDSALFEPNLTRRPETDDELRERVLGGHLDNNGAGSLLACSFADTSFSDRGRELPPINEATGADLDRYATLAGLTRRNAEPAREEQPERSGCSSCLSYCDDRWCLRLGITIDCPEQRCTHWKPSP
jgi:hypothetical protein